MLREKDLKKNHTYYHNNSPMKYQGKNERQEHVFRYTNDPVWYEFASMDLSGINTDKTVAVVQKQDGTMEVLDDVIWGNAMTMIDDIIARETQKAKPAEAGLHLVPEETQGDLTEPGTIASPTYSVTN